MSGNAYGKIDAPQLWYETWDQEARAAGFTRSRFDKCLYYMRDEESHSVQGIFVDDTLPGGKGTRFEASIARLRSRFPFRKWSTGSGEFRGSIYTQDRVSKTIIQSQKSFASEKIAHIKISRTRKQELDQHATDAEVSAIRAVAGAGNWISSQSRPDLSRQVSLSLQTMPKPTVHDVDEINHMVRRAKQFADHEVRYTH